MADITTQSAKYGDTDNTLLLKAATALQDLATGGGGTVAIDQTTPGTTNGVVVNGGNVAAEDADSGNPVKVGGVYNATPPTYTTADRTNLQQDSRGNVKVAIFEPNGTGAVTISGSGDAVAGRTGFVTVGETTHFNGATWDRVRNNLQAVLLASAARTTTQTGADITNYNGRFLDVILSMTTVGTGSVTVSIEAKDANGIYYPLLTGAAVITDTTNVYRVGPGLTIAANLVANAAVPRTFRIVVTANNANSATYSVAYALSV